VVFCILVCMILRLPRAVLSFEQGFDSLVGINISMVASLSEIFYLTALQFVFISADGCRTLVQVPESIFFGAVNLRLSQATEPF